MPCVPFASLLAGTYIRPQIGSNVWVEFERGDADKPIWTGGWWGDGDIPVLAEEAAGVTPVITIATGIEGISISETPITVGLAQPGNVNLSAGGGSTVIALGSDSVSITAQQVTITCTTFSVTTPNGTFTVS
jgi:hypothetical protein